MQPTVAFVLGNLTNPNYFGKKMGGFGSGRKPSFDRKTRVEECEQLAIKAISARCSITLNDINDLRIYMDRFILDLTICTVSSKPFQLRLRYSVGNRPLKYKIYLEATPCHFGGLRWWFLCPLLKGDTVCGRRCTKLYVPPGQLYFGCRACYDLTYKSVQEAHKAEREGVGTFSHRIRREWAILRRLLYDESIGN